MNRRVVGKLALLVAGLLAAPAAACRFAYCAQRLAPADQQLLPANARALIAQGKQSARLDPATGETVVWTPWIKRLNADGGVDSLVALPADSQPSGFYGNATLFGPGSLTAGDQFRIESSVDCSPPSILPHSEIQVIEAAPIPGLLGTVSSPPSAPVPEGPPACGPGPGLISRDLFLELDDSVRPWASIARVNLEVNGVPRSTPYGRLAYDTDGPPVFVEQLTRRCTDPLTGEPTHTLETWLVKLELEIPGFTERPPPVEYAAEMDCSPSCASTGIGPLILGVLVLAFRRGDRHLACEKPARR